MNEIAPYSNTTDIICDKDLMKILIRLSECMASGVATVPKHLQGNASDCLAVIMQATQWKMNPFAVAQKTSVINGTLCYQAHLVNAVVSSSKAITGRFKYEYQGFEDKSLDGHVRCGAVLNGETGITWGEWIDTSMVKVKNSPLWKTAPKQQASYLAVKYWSRLYCPDVILGVYTPDEINAPQSPRVINGDEQSKTRQTLLDQLKDDVTEDQQDTSHQYEQKSLQ